MGIGDGESGFRLKKTEKNEKESYKIEGAESSHTRKKTTV